MISILFNRKGYLNTCINSTSHLLAFLIKKESCYTLSWCTHYWWYLEIGVFLTMYIYININIYMCVCVCHCVSVYSQLCSWEWVSYHFHQSGSFLSFLSANSPNYSCIQPSVGWRTWRHILIWSNPILNDLGSKYFVQMMVLLHHWKKNSLKKGFLNATFDSRHLSLFGTTCSSPFTWKNRNL